MTSAFVDTTALIAALKKPWSKRSDTDLSLIKRATKDFHYFRALEDPHLHVELCRHLHYKLVPEIGQNIVTQGDIGTTFYIILSGTARVLKNYTGTTHSEGIHVSEDGHDLQPGDSFGELALIGNGLRAATVEVHATPGSTRRNSGKEATKGQG